MSFTNRPYQEECLDANIRCLRGGLMRLLNGAPTGCHAKDQLVMLASGECEKVQNIRIGDSLMGPDGATRTVLSLIQSFGEMCRIVPRKGKAWTVNLDHVLTLIRTNEASKPKYECEKRGGEIIDVTVREYLKWSKWKKHIHKLFRVGVDDFHNDLQVDDELDPYVLGVLLGDGLLTRSDCAMWWKPDHEIVESIQNLVSSLGLHVKSHGSSHRISGTPKHPNPITKCLQKLDVLNTKSQDRFVPKSYLLATREQRLALLAGLLDTDGSLSRRAGYEVTFKSLQLSTDTTFLARSLGFGANINSKTLSSGPYAGNVYWRVHINGACDTIPLRIPRKMAFKRQQKKDPLRTGFKVEPAPPSDYYGFSLSGDGRYLLDDFTVTHNSGKTVIFSQLPSRMADHGFMSADQRVLVLAHRDELLEQAKQKIQRVEPTATIGLEQGSTKSSQSDKFVLASVQTLGRRSSRRLTGLNPGSFGLVLVDEAHHAAAPSYRRILEAFPKCPHIGFTATPFRADKKSLADVFDDVAYRIGLADLMKPRPGLTEGWLAKAIPYRRESKTDLSGVSIKRGEYVAEELENTVNTDARNELVINAHFTLGQGERSLVFAAGVKHGRDICNLFLSYGVPAAFVYGDTDKGLRKAYIEGFKDGDLRVLVNVGVLTEGYDEPLIKNVILARPTRSPLIYAQQIGRALRIPEEAEVGQLVRQRFFEANIIDIADAGRTLQNMNLLRLFGVQKDIDPDGRDVLEIRDEIADAEARGHVVNDVEDLDKLVKDKDFFDIPVLDGLVKRNSKYVWQQMADGSYYLPLPNKGAAHLYEDVMGRVVLDVKFEESTESVVLDKKKPRSLVKLLDKADKHLRANAPKENVRGQERSIMERVEWYWIDKPWGRQPASEAQLTALRRWNVRHQLKQDQEYLTKGEASMLLTRVVALRTAKTVERI